MKAVAPNSVKSVQLLHRPPVARNISPSNLDLRPLASGAKPFDSIPGPKGLPLIGNIWRYLPLIGNYRLDTLFENALYNRRRYGPIVRERITNKHTILHLFEPADIESFFRQDGKEPHRRSHRALLKYRHSREDRYNDGGLFPENGTSWSRLRQLFQHTLMSPQQVSLRIPILNRIVQRTLDKLDSQCGRNLQQARVSAFDQIVQRWAIESALAVFLDFDHCDSNNSGLPDEHTVVKLWSCLHEELEAIDGTEIRTEKWLRAPSKCPFYQKLALSESFVYEFVDARVKQLLEQRDSIAKVSFVRQWLLEQHLEVRDVVTLVIDCILASLHTTTYVTMFLLKRLSDDKQILNQVRQEISATGDTNEMTLLKDCLRETLRLHPVAIGTGRLTQGSNMIVGGYRLPANLMVIAHNQTICQDETIYERANKFEPQRWARYRQMRRQDRPSPFAWQPYGFGPRTCIGKRLANSQITLFVARMIQHFDFTFEPNEFRTKTSLIHQLCGQIDIKLTKIIDNEAIPSQQ